MYGKRHQDYRRGGGGHAPKYGRSEFGERMGRDDGPDNSMGKALPGAIPGKFIGIAANIDKASADLKATAAREKETEEGLKSIVNFMRYTKKWDEEKIAHMLRGTAFADRADLTGVAKAQESKESKAKAPAQKTTTESKGPNAQATGQEKPAADAPACEKAEEFRSAQEVLDFQQYILEQTTTGVQSPDGPCNTFWMERAVCPYAGGCRRIHSHPGNLLYGSTTNLSNFMRGEGLNMEMTAWRQAMLTQFRAQRNQDSAPVTGIANGGVNPQ